MFCIHCGAANDGTMTACTACGHSNATVRPPELVKRLSEAANDSGAALLLLGANPTGALHSTFAALGEKRALGVGAAFGIYFAIATMLAAWIASTRIGLGFQPRVLFAALLTGLVLFASLAAGGAAGRKLLRGTGTLGSDVYLAGAASLPIGILLLAGSVVGGQNAEVVAIAAFFLCTYAFSILYAGVTRLTGISERLAPPFIAALLLLSLWLSKVALVAVLGRFNPFGSIFG